MFILSGILGTCVTALFSDAATAAALKGDDRAALGNGIFAVLSLAATVAMMFL